MLVNYRSRPWHCVGVQLHDILCTSRAGTVQVVGTQVSKRTALGAGAVAIVALMGLGVVQGLVRMVPSTQAATGGPRVHPHEGASGALPDPVAEGYDSRTGTAVAYAGTAKVGLTSILFDGSAATYFDDRFSAPTATGDLVWSAPIRVHSLPVSAGYDKFVLARAGTSPLAAVELSSTGQLRIRDGAGLVKATSATAIRVDTWYTVEVKFSSGLTTLRLFDGSGGLVETLGPVATTAGSPTGLRTGLRATGAPLYIDQVQVADSWITFVPPPRPSPCGSLTSAYDPVVPPRYQHVVILMEENLSYSQFLSSTNAPYLAKLSSQCGSESNFHVATHPSQPNYMAATSGIPSGLGVKTAADNIFQQVQAAGLTWKSYQESMPANCAKTNNGFYKPGHNPAYYYTDLANPNTCSLNDVPMDPAMGNDIAADSLPAYSWITPNQCHIFYWTSVCPTPQADRIKEGDKWLSNLIPELTAMPSYQAGQTLVIVTFDEGLEVSNVYGVDCTDPSYYASHTDCQVATVVVSPYVAPGSVDNSDQNLYSLLGTTEDVLGLPRLERAVDQPTMRTGLRF